jgi:hypothetical protein
LNYSKFFWVRNFRDCLKEKSTWHSRGGHPLHRNHGEREAVAEFAVDFDFDGVESEAGELDSTEDVDVRGVGVERG